jgi:hypothetical protein
MISANFEGLKYAHDLPTDHVYGVPTPNTQNDIDGTLKNFYNSEKQNHFERVDVEFRP